MTPTPSLAFDPRPELSRLTLGILREWELSPAYRA
jgi:hypothetical protein